MKFVSSSALQEDLLKESVSDPAAGGVVFFEGRVRNHNEGAGVSSLEYEAFAELAETECEKILSEAKERFKVEKVHCVHRVGHLQIGEVAVWVGASAAHRAEAFAACRYVIDEVKARLPVWKKEHYVDGKAKWVDCRQCSGYKKESTEVRWTEEDERQFYSRQTKLKEVGIVGQEKLKKARVLVVGAGGLGCPALSYLTGSGIGHLGICDDDVVSLSNLQRQVLYLLKDIGQNKVDVARQRLKLQNPFIDVVTFAQKFNCEILKDYDLVLDGTDNFSTKFAVHQACFDTKTPLVQASIFQYDGQIQVFHFSKDEPCLNCLWPEPPTDGCVSNCTEAGVLGATAGVFGALMATEAIKVLLDMPGQLRGETLFFDLLTHSSDRMKQTRRADCVVCGESVIVGSFENVAAFEVDTNDWQEFDVIDIREKSEVEVQPGSGRNIPQKEFWRQRRQLDPQKKYLLVCQKGIRSQNLASRFREEGMDNVFSFKSGVDGMGL